jgi:Cu/Ag efflux pump CusA
MRPTSWETWPVTGDAVINGKPGLLLIVEKYLWANTLEATRGVEDALKAQKRFAGVAIDPIEFSGRPTYRSRVRNLKSALLLGCALVAVIIAAFLVRAANRLISLLAIPCRLWPASWCCTTPVPRSTAMILGRLRRCHRRRGRRCDYRRREHRPAAARMPQKRHQNRLPESF